MAATQLDDTPGFPDGGDDSRTDDVQRSPLSGASTAGDVDMGDAAMQARLARRMFGGEPPLPAVGRFSVIRKIGSGGMGAVYEAHDPELDRNVALKLLHPELDQEHQVRLRREAQALARVTHRNVVHVYEVGSHEGRLFIAMELIAGEPLNRWLRTESRPTAAVLDTYLQAGEGLQAAHDAGLVHRDFKPANVILGTDGVVRVLDFGLARGVPNEGSEARFATEPLSPSVLAARITVTGTTLGTPMYMSPEQMCGRPASRASDQFSFCVALYEGLYGHHPFEGKTSGELYENALSGKLRTPTKSGIPKRILQAIGRGLRATPEDRFPSVAALVAELRKSAPRSRSTFLVTVGLAAVAAAGVPLVLAQNQDECESRAAEGRQIWTQSQRRRLSEQFGANSSAFIPVEKALTTWVDDWKTTYQSVCDAEFADSRERVLVTACLENQLENAETTIEFLSSADESVVHRAQFVVNELPKTRTCRAKRGGSDRRAEAALLEARLALAAGQQQQAKTLAQQIAESAQESGKKRDWGEALLVLGELHHLEGDLAAARDNLQRASQLGLEDGAPQLTFDAWEKLGWVETTLASEYERARELHDSAHSLLPRLASPGSRPGKLKFLEAAILSYELASREAKSVLAEARAELERTEPSTSAIFEKLQRYTGSIAADMEDYDGALAAYEEVRKAIVARAGPESFELAGLEYDIGWVHYHAGDHERAQTLLLGSLERVENSGQPHTRLRRSALMTLAQTKIRLGDLDGAYDAADAAVTLVEQTDPTGVDHLSALAILTNILQKQERWKEGLQAVEASIAVRAALGTRAPPSNDEFIHLWMSYQAGETEPLPALVAGYRGALASKREATRDGLTAIAEYDDQLYADFIAASGLDPADYGAPPVRAVPAQP